MANVFQKQFWENWLSVARLGRRVRRGDLEIAMDLYKYHKAGIMISERNISDGSSSVVDEVISKVSRSLGERFGGEDDAKRAKYEGRARTALRTLTGRKLSEWLMGDFFGGLKLWSTQFLIDEFHKKNPHLSEESVLEIVAPIVNDAFGGQNWHRYWWATPKTLQALNLLMFAPNWCCPIDTQALTKTGWKKHSELTIGDEIMIFDPGSGETRWGAIQDKFEDHDYAGDMVYVKTYNRELAMTPEHTCIVETRRHGTQTVKASALARDHGIPRCAPHGELPETATIDDRLVVFVGWLVTDGYVKRCHKKLRSGKQMEYRYGRIKQSKPSTVALLKELGLRYYVERVRDTNFKCNYPPHTFLVPKKDYDELERLGVRDASLSWEFLSKLTFGQLRLLEDTMMLGDGTGNKRFCGKEQEVFWMSLIRTLLGKPITFYEQKQLGGRCWRTREISAETISCRMTETRTYSGGIWCPTVETGFWVAQRDGVVFITGNSLSAANVGGLGLITGHALGNYMSPEQARFVARNWVTMYLVALLIVPNILQAAIYGLGHALPGDDDDEQQEKEDRMFATFNEVGKGQLFPHIDITPLMRKVPGYRGDPTGRRRTYVRFGKQSYEVLNGWLKAPGQTAGRKSSMLVKAVWEQLTGYAPGSPDYELPFRGAGPIMGLIDSKIGFRGSRIGTLLSKALPMTISSALSNPDAFITSIVVPASKGMSQTRAIQGMMGLLRAYAEGGNEGIFMRHPEQRANLNSLAARYMDALERNGYDSKQVITSAKGDIMRTLYADFYEGFIKGDEARMHDAAKRIYRVQGTTDGLLRSVDSRQEKTGRPPLTETERTRVLEAFEGAVPDFVEKTFEGEE